MDLLSRAIGWWTPNCFDLVCGGLYILLPGRGWNGYGYVCFFQAVERVDVLCCVLFLFYFFELRRYYTSLSSIGMVLAVEVGLRDSMDSMSVFIIHPS